MDILEFAEKFMNVELLEYQKRFLRDLENAKYSGDIRIVMPKGLGRTQAYIYIDQFKELIQHG